MNDYTALRVNLTPCNQDMTDLLAAYLADAGYESFLPDVTGLTAYIPASLFDLSNVYTILEEFPYEVEASVEHSTVEGKDWNNEWEKNYFQPIVIDDKCVIHSSFHTDIPHAKYEIIIDPKMAFGTGHHATTSMMINHLLDADLRGYKIIDMGTGTGILAILSKMLGAGEVYGIEIDPVAYNNALENVEINKVEVNLLQGDSLRLKDIPQADIMVANINRNVILADLDRYVESIKRGGELILSGFYESDFPLIEKAAEMCGLELSGRLTMSDPNLTEDDPAKTFGKWGSLKFKKR